MYYTSHGVKPDARDQERPPILGGKPVIEGTRISVEQVLGLLAKGRPPRVHGGDRPRDGRSAGADALDPGRMILDTHIIVWATL